MSDNVPYEIQLEIIKKVPEFKSLIRFRYKEIINPREFKHISFVDDVTFPQQRLDFSPNAPDLVKQLRVLDIRDTNNIPWQVEVFTLNSKTWKMIPSSNLPRESVRLISSTQVAIDRFIFWVAYDRIVSNNDVVFKNLILSFDLITHEFKEVNLPDSIANRDSSISMFNESLVVSASINEVNGIVYGVWIMGMEGGVMTSFTKLFNINTPDDLLISKVLGYKKSGEPIMETVKEDQQFAALEVYEPCSERINSLGIYAEFDSLFIFPYKETLLLAESFTNVCG
nr:hypothetical protein [Tanacetum cinerariifolium]